MGTDSLNGNTLYREVERIDLNFKKFNDEFTEFNFAAEMINVIFRELIGKSIKVGTEPKWLYASSLMVFGSYQSWIIAYIMTCSGFHDIGLMSLRRAIEFVCYLSKVYKSDERAEIWMSKWNDVKKKKKFSSIFSIPQNYFTDEYEYLNELIALHDYASDFGVHGNYEVLADKCQQVKNSNEIVFTLQSFRKDIYSPVSMVLLSGYRILQSIEKRLKNNIENHDKISALFKELSKMIQKAKIKFAEIDFRGFIPREIWDAILSDDNTGLDSHFKSLKEKYSKNE